MSRALLITPIWPDAFGEGRAKRAHQWLWRLAQDHEVDVLVVDLTVDGLPEPASSPLAARTLVYRVPPPSLLGRRSRRLRAIFGGNPVFWLSMTPALASFLGAHFAGEPYDRLVCFRLYLAEAGALLSRSPGAGDRLLDLDDLEADTRASIARRCLRDGRLLSALFEAGELRAWRRLEAAWSAPFERLTVCCEADRVKLSRRLSGRAVEVMPNRFWRGALPRDLAPAGAPRRVLFVGLLSYAPNEAAVLFFARRVLPKLRAVQADWRFVVVGRGASQALRRRLARCPGVELVGAVDDVAPWYAGCGLVVAPLQAGGGTKLKVLEALCFERPLVATAEAVRGLELVAGRHYLAAETPEAFAEACRRLAETPALARRIVAEGRAHAGAAFSYGEEGGR